MRDMKSGRRKEVSKSVKSFRPVIDKLSDSTFDFQWKQHAASVTVPSVDAIDTPRDSVLPIPLPPQHPATSLPDTHITTMEQRKMQFSKVILYWSET